MGSVGSCLDTMFWPDKFFQHCLGLVRYSHNSFSIFLLDRNDCQNRRNHGSLRQSQPQIYGRTSHNCFTSKKKTLYRGVRRAHSSCAPNTVQTSLLLLPYFCTAISLPLLQYFCTAIRPPASVFLSCYPVSRFNICIQPTLLLLPCCIS
jgi:hypothetical protein